METMGNLPNVIESKNNERKLLIGRHQLAVNTEINRQNNLASISRTRCQAILQRQENEFIKVCINNCG